MVKRKLCVRLLSAILTVLALIIALCSCTPKNEPDVLSGEEIAMLRDTYPLDDSSMTSGDPITLEKAAAKSNAVAVVTVTDEWFTKTFSASTTGDSDEPFSNAVECAYLPVRISDLLYGDGTLAEGDEISLFFGSTLFFDSFDTYPVNGRFLCFIAKGEGIAYYDDTVYSTAKQCSAYVTDDDYILSIMSKGPFEDYTGYALASYSVQLDNMLTELNEIAAE